MIDEKEKIVVEPEGSFISNFYQKVWFIEESFIWLSQKDELMLMFFWLKFSSKDELISLIESYKKSIVDFRDCDIEKKGFILYFIELIVSDKINIQDKYYNTLQETHTDKMELINLSTELIVSWLWILKEEIKLLLESYKNFFDKYISFDSNYLSNQELDWFKSHFLCLFWNLYTYVILNQEVVEKIKEIEFKIKNNIILN